MPRRPSYEQRVLPRPSGADRRASIDSALAHAGRMKDAGLLSPGEVADLMQACIGEHLNTYEDDEFDQLPAEDFERMRELSGYEADENEDDADDRRESVVAKIFAHMMLEAVDKGYLSAKQALQALAEYIAVPEGDPRGVAGQLMRDIHSGKRLRLAGETDVSDADVEEALGKMVDRRGAPLMKPRRG